MRVTIKARPEDFVVEEVLAVRPGEMGDHAVYKVTKRLLTTLEVQERIARQINVPPRTVVFPALKDKGALATQYCTLHGHGPQRMTGNGYEAELVGRLSQHLSPRDMQGNRFTIAIGAQSPQEAERLAARLAEMGRTGLPNYFDEQRFGSYTPGGAFVGKAILQRDAETALRAYFTEIAPGDPPELRAFKRVAKERWGDWSALFDQAPRSNHRSILSFLKDHPADFRKALNLITPRLLPLLLSAYQSFLWNRIASRYLALQMEGENQHQGTMRIAGEDVAVYRSLSREQTEALRRIALPLPHHQAMVRDSSLARIMDETLAQEGLRMPEMKARILRNAYLTKSERPLLLFPKDVAVEVTNIPGARAQFFLPPGAYATLVVKAAAATA